MNTEDDNIQELEQELEDEARAQKPPKNYDEQGRVIRPNRSARRREMLHTKDFARQLLELPTHQYTRLPIDQRLHEALIEGKRLKDNALRRHLSFLSRLIDEQGYAAIAAAYQRINHPYRQDADKQRLVLSLMERLAVGERAVYQELLHDYQNCDLQHLSQLLRAWQNAQNALERAKAGELSTEALNSLRQRCQNAHRNLYRYLNGLELQIHE